PAVATFPGSPLRGALTCKDPDRAGAHLCSDLETSGGGCSASDGDGELVAPHLEAQIIAGVGARSGPHARKRVLRGRRIRRRVEERIVLARFGGRRRGAATGHGATIDLLALEARPSVGPPAFAFADYVRRACHERRDQQRCGKDEWLY